MRGLYPSDRPANRATRPTAFRPRFKTIKRISLPLHAGRQAETDFRPPKLLQTTSDAHGAMLFFHPVESTHPRVSALC